MAMDQATLDLAARELPMLMTPGYRPSTYGFGLGMSLQNGLPPFSMDIVDAMRRDYQVKLAMTMKVVPVMKPLFAITGDPEVVEFVKNELRSIWTSSITDMTEAMWYTRFACEMVYKKADGDVWRFARMMPYHPRDFNILTKNGEITGAKIIASSNSVDIAGNGKVISSSAVDDRNKAILFAPKCFVYVHDKKFGSFDGMSELEGAYPSWMEKTREGGAVASRSLWGYKCMFDSGMIIHPEGSYTDELGRQIPYRDFALKIGEAIRNGSVVAVPGITDAGGNRLWDWIRPEINSGGQALMDLIDHLDGKINKGCGIPDDVIEQVSGTGSYAGRTIPFIAFLEAGTPTVRNISRELCRQVLVPLAQVNFGESRGKDWEITEAGVNTKEFLGDAKSTQKPGNLPGDGDGDGIPNEAQQQMSLESVSRFADKLNLSGMQRTRFSQAGVGGGFSGPRVVFEDEPRRKVLRAKQVQMSVADQPRDEFGRWTSGHSSFSGKLPKNREKLHPIDATQAVNSMGFHVGLQHKDPETGRTVYKVLNSRGEVKHLNADELRNLAYSTPDEAGKASATEIMDTIHKIEPAAWRGALIGSRELREAVGEKLSKAEFDSKILEMARNGELSLHHHDYASSLSDAERDELISYPVDQGDWMSYDGRKYVVGVAVRPRQMSLGGEFVDMGQGTFNWKEDEHPRDHGKFSSKPGASGIADEPFSLKREKSRQFKPKNSSGEQADLYSARKATHSPADDAVKPQVESLPGQKTIEGNPVSVSDALMSKMSHAEWQTAMIYAAYDDDGKVRDQAAVDALDQLRMQDYFEAQHITGKHVVTERGGPGIVIGFTPDARAALVRYDDGTIAKHVPELTPTLDGYVKHRLSKGKDLPTDVQKYFINLVAADAVARNVNISAVLKEHGLEPKDFGRIRSAVADATTALKESQKEQPSDARARAMKRQEELNAGTEQMSQSSPEQSGRWITIGGHEGSGDKGGCKVFIGRNGRILKGPAGLKGENLKTLGDKDSKESREARAAHAKAQGKTGHDLTEQEARKLGSKAHVTAHAHAKDEARMAGVSTHDVLQNMSEAHKYRLEQHGQREHAKTRARQMTGMNAGNLAKFENTYKDYSTVPGFDTAARTIAMEHPELGLDPDGDETAPAVWELIREGKVEEPKLHDRETARQAAEWINQARRHHKVATKHDPIEDTSFNFGFGHDQLGEGETPFIDFSQNTDGDQ